MAAPGKRILIADDEAAIVLSLQFLMRQAGFDTATVEDGEQALTRAAVYLPHLILLDVMLPVRNGLDVCRALRADPRHAGLRIVLLTAKGGGGLESQAFADRVGADRYLVKPFATRELLALVRELLGVGK